MLRVLSLCLVVLAGPASANYCPPEHIVHTTRWPGEPVEQPPASPATLFGAIAGLIAGLLLGSMLRTSPTQASVLAAIDKAFDGRLGEAGTHSRGKFPPALEAARKSVKGEVAKVFKG